MTEKTSRTLRWIWPFPRLRFRLRHGRWCTHSWGDWRMINTGAGQVRYCEHCDYADFR